MKVKATKKTQPNPHKQKVQQKHLQTFSSSQFSVFQQKSKPFQASVTSLTILKSEAKPIRKVLQKKKKKTHSKSKGKIKHVEEPFEKIAYQDSHSQSFIIFSNDETQREQKESLVRIENAQHIKSITDSNVNPNLVLRINIKKQYIRKTQAATKIQKVLRGFMTRKILNKCIQEEQEKLKYQKNNNLKLHLDESRQNQTYRTFVDKDSENLVNRLFESKNTHDIHFNHSRKPRADCVSSNQQDDYFQEMEVSMGKEQIIVQSERGEENESSESSQQDSSMIYRRQNPIYSQSEISHYLESSEEQQEEVDIYEPDIIFETNEEYLESRKSSLQNKNQTINKLSNKGLADIALVGFGPDHQIRKQLRPNNQNDNIITSQVKPEGLQNFHPSALPQQVFTQSKEQDEWNIQKDTKNKTTIELEDKTYEKQKQKQKTTKQMKKQQKVGSPRREVKYLDEQFMRENSECHSNRTNKTKKSQQQKQILRLKEQQRDKWEEVIKMVSHQIEKNQQNSGEMSNFMQTIMDLSQKNKELLGSTCSVNSQSQVFYTPTSQGINVFGLIEAKSCPINEKQRESDNQSSEDKNQTQDNNGKFFKKKKLLKIDVSDEKMLESNKISILEKPSDHRIQVRKKGQIQYKKSFHKKSIDHLERQQFSKKVKMGDEKQQEEWKVKSEFENVQNSKRLKNFLSSNIQDSAVYDILRLRQELLQNRQSEELTNLNNLLSQNQLTQQDFLKRLSNLTNKFLTEKLSIDKAKQDILKGYQTANDLVKEYFYDVRRMGIKLALSRSQDNLKYKLCQPLYFTGDIQIDELPSKTISKAKENIKVPMKQIFADYEIEQQKIKENSSNHNFQSSQESSIDFTEQELKRFRKAANYDLQFNDLNKNLAISDDFIKQQRKYVQEELSNKQTIQSPQKQILTMQPLKQTYHLDDEKVPSSRTPPHIESIIESEIQRLVWQFAAELIIRPSISDKFIDRSTFVRPLQVSIQERLCFIKVLEQNLPETASLHRKLNQNITPLPSQILKCMRLDFSQGNEECDDENYEEINKYEFVISQQSCAKSIMLFKTLIDDAEEQKRISETISNTHLMTSFEGIVQGLPIMQKMQNFMKQRQKFMKNRRERTRELRWEVINIQLHCIFDSWNEEIVQICSARAGFSGIGLNQLTLSMINHNRNVPIVNTLQIIQQAKEKVIEILNDDMDINAKILKQNYHEMCETDSAWIFYADEALSYALELVYLVEQQLYTQIVKDLRKIMVKNCLSL